MNQLLASLFAKASLPVSTPFVKSILVTDDFGNEVQWAYLPVWS